MKTLDIKITGFENAVVTENETSYFVDLRTGLGAGEYPKSDFTLEEAIDDQINLGVE